MLTQRPSDQRAQRGKVGMTLLRGWLALCLAAGAPCVLARSALAQVAVDASSSATASSSSLAWSHTVGSGASRFLVVGVSIRGNRTVTGITYGASPLTSVGTQQNHDGTVRMAIWSLVAPASGTATITVTLSGSAKVVGGAVSFTGVDPSTPLGTFASVGSTGGGSTNPSVNATSAANDLVVDVLATDGGAGTLTPGAGQTQRWNLFYGTSAADVAGAGSTEPGAASVTMSWTTTATTKWAIGAVSVKPAPTVSVTPDGGRDLLHLPSGPNYSFTFTVTNGAGAGAQSYDLLASKTGTAITIVSVNGVAGDSTRILNLASGAAQTIAVLYSIGNVAAGTVDTVRLVARNVGSATVSDPGSADLLVVRPNIATTKSVSPSGSELPGTDLTYQITVTNGGTAAAESVITVDSLSALIEFKVGSVTSTPPPGVSVVVEYSNDAGASWTYTPASGGCGAAAGYDRCVTRVRWRFLNPLTHVAPDNDADLGFVARIR